MPIDEDFGKRVQERIEIENALFASAVENIKCPCFAGETDNCRCTNKERACRWLKEQPTADRHFNDEQRDEVINDAYWLAEGGFNREELEAMSDAELGCAWLEAASDYAQSQAFFG